MSSIIPKGMKCFELIEVVNFAKGEAIIDPCEYFEESGDGRFRCSFLGIECEYGDEDFKIWDREKECNINTYSNIIEPPEYYFDID